MNAIWKYTLEVVDTVQVIQMPVGAVVRRVGAQNGRITLWVECPMGESKHACHFRVRGTGHEFDGREEFYIGSVDIEPFVWHVLRVIS